MKAGTHVSWNTPQGRTRGKIIERKTSDFQLDGHTFRASEDNPMFVVESEGSGARAAHRADALAED